MQNYVIRDNRVTQLRNMLTFKGATETVQLDYSPWSDDNGNVSAVVAEVVNGQATVANESLSSNVKSLTIATSNVGYSDIKFTATAGNNVNVSTLRVFAKDHKTPIHVGIPDSAGFGQDGLKHSVTGTSAPTVNDDSSLGFSVRSEWIDITNDLSYICVDATVGAAIWKLQTTTHSVETKADLSALNVTPFSDGDIVTMAYRATAGDQGGGDFYWDSSDLSTEVTNDTQEGVYVPPDSDSSGASGSWVRIYSGAVNVKWFGALIDGSTDDDTAVTAALTSFDNVYIPAGTCVTGTLTLSSLTDKTIFGDGSLSVIKQKNSNNAQCFLISSSDRITIRDLKLDGNSANNGTTGEGIRVTGSSSDLVVERCEITDFKTHGIGSASTCTGTNFTIRNCWIHTNVGPGTQISAIERTHIYGCKVNNNTGNYGILIANGAHNSIVENCIVHDNSVQGISFVESTGTLTDVIAANNRSYDNGSHGIHFNGVLRGVMSGNNCSGNGTSGLDITLGSNYCTITGNISFNNTVRGIEVDSVSIHASVTGNVVYGNGEEGIDVYRSAATIMMGNQVMGNSTSSAGTYHGIRLFDNVGGNPSSNCVIMGNIIADDAGSKTQHYAISLEDAAADTIIIGNRLGPNLTGAINSASAAEILSAYGNYDYTTENSGTATITSGTTSVTVTHGVDFTPTIDQIFVTMGENPTNDPGNIWVDTITSTQFNINCRADPGASNLDFGWRVKVLG